MAKVEYLNTNMAQEVEGAIQLRDQLWIYLNPYGNDTIEKAATFDFLLLMMFNIAHQTESDVAQVLAAHLIRYYEQFDIVLRPESLGQGAGAEQDGVNEGQNEIDPRFQNTDLNGIGSSFSARSHRQSSTGAKAQTDVQVVDKFFVTRKKAWPLHKLIHEFKLEHAQRFSRTQHDRTSVDRAGSKNTNPLLTRNKSLQRVFPNDTRKYKESSIKELEKQYTFAPNLNPISL